MKANVTSFLNSLHAAGIRPEARSVNYPNSYELNAEGALIGLNLSGLNLQRLHLPLAGLEELQKLDLSKNAFTSLSFEGGLPALTFLDISYNGGELNLLEFPAGFERLKYLYLYQSELSALEFQGEMPALNTLNLQNNQLTRFQLPQNTQNLESLYLEENQLTQLPFVLADVPKLAFLSLKKNPLGLDSAIFEESTNCWSSLKSYLKAAAQSGLVINKEAKCIFFGNGRVGKTTLFNQLKENVFDPTIVSTHGILIDEWEIKAADFPPNLKDKIQQIIDQNPTERLTMPDSVILNVWDFGGQDYYHATHRLFLNSNVLYILVWDTETNRHFEDVEHEIEDFPLTHWQENIHFYAPENLTLEVQNKASGSVSIDHPNLKFKVEKREDNYKRSLQLFEFDIDDLKAGIYGQLANLSYLGKTIPKLYEDIRKAITDTSKVYMDFEEYQRDFCIANDNTPDKIMQNENDIREITQFLHHTGKIICYRYDTQNKSDKLRKIVFTKPEWVTATIYEILDEKTLKNKGEFDIKHVKEAIHRPLKKFPDIKQPLTPEDWIDLMKHFKLIFEITEDGKKKFIAPQYLPESCTEQKAFRVYNTHKTDFAFALRFPDFLPKSVMGNFLSDYGSKHENHLYWKNALVFHEENEKGETITAFVRQVKEENVIKVNIHKSSENMALAVKIFRHLAGIHEEGEREKIAKFEHKDIQIQVVEDKDWVAINELWNCPEGNTYLKTVEGNSIPKSRFLPFRNGVFTMEKTNKTPEPSPVKKVYLSYDDTDEICFTNFQKFLIPLENNGKIKILYRGAVGYGENLSDTNISYLEQADIWICLVSQSYLASDKIEIEREMVFHRKPIPVLLSAATIQYSELSGVKPFPNNEYIESYSKHKQDELWLELTNILMKAIENPATEKSGTAPNWIEEILKNQKEIKAKLDVGFKETMVKLETADKKQIEALALSQHSKTLLAEIYQKLEEMKEQDIERFTIQIEKAIDNLPASIHSKFPLPAESQYVNVSGKFKLMIPIIPMVLEYEKEISIDLLQPFRDIWKSLRSSFTG